MKSDMPFSIHNYIRGVRGKSAEPYAIPIGTVKKYPRMSKVALDEPVDPEISLAAALRNRRSFGTEVSLNLRNLDTIDISTLFGVSLRSSRDGRRPYPSGGALYPIETYFIGNIGAGAHVYHYDPEEHALDDLWELPADRGIIDIVPGSELSAPACVVFTAQWRRNGVKYGDFGYYLGMLEAGHAAQNILLASTALGVAARAIGGFDDATLTELLDLDVRIEQPVYVLLIGKKKV